MPTAQATAQRKYIESVLPRIRGMAACNMTSTQIAQELGLRVQAVCRICNRLNIKFAKRPHMEVRLKRPLECPVNERRRAHSADELFSVLMAKRRFESPDEPPQPRWRGLPPVTTVVGSTSSMGGRYG